MATHAKRQQALEAFSPKQLAAFKWAGHEKTHHDPAERIASILRDAEKGGHGDDLDRLLGLPTDAEQQLDLQHQSVIAAKASARASFVSATCAVLAVAISVLALWVAGRAGE